MGLLAALACLLSAAPWPVRLAGAVLAGAQGVRLARREGARDPLRLQFAADYRTLRVGGCGGSPTGRAIALAQLRIQLRGTLASLEGLDAGGRAHRLSWWPDTLGPVGRRVLRIAAGAPTGEGVGESVAETGPTLATMPG